MTITTHYTNLGNSLSFQLKILVIQNFNDDSDLYVTIRFWISRTWNSLNEIDYFSLQFPENEFKWHNKLLDRGKIKSYFSDIDDVKIHRT